MEVGQIPVVQIECALVDPGFRRQVRHGDFVVLHGNLGDDDLSVTDFVGDSSPERGAKAAALMP